MRLIAKWHEIFLRSFFAGVIMYPLFLAVAFLTQQLLGIGILVGGFGILQIAFFLLFFISAIDGDEQK